MPQEPKTNLRVWDKLSTTDPEQTKKFTRSGGFSGTAIKPIWTIHRMTEEFGPCGEGWGMSQPIFEVHDAGAERMVFCTVSLWWKQGDTMSAPVWGVGGDKLLAQIFEKDRSGNKVKDDLTGRFRTYPQSDDESFKKAYTDALSNAMKFIGMAADVHMGLFDDSKYIEKVTEEYQEKKGVPKVIPLPEANKLKELAKSKDAESVKRLMAEMKIPRITATTVDQLDGFRAALEGL